MPRCPSCFTPMTRVENDNSIRLATCASCFGTWIDSLMLTRLTRLAASTPVASVEAASLPDLAAVVAESNSTQELRCPQCGKIMRKDRFHPMIPVTVDRCGACDFVWLDAGEMAMIQRLNHELMTSQDPEIVRRREKVAAVAAQWQSRTQARDSSMRDVSAAGQSTAMVFDLLNFLLTR